jgi:drug/metabolite transporter (DMT)-like permease
MILVVIMYAIFSITFTLGKQAMSYGQPILFVSLRMLFAGLILLGYQYFYTSHSFYIARKHRGKFLSIAFFQFYAAYCLQYWALPAVPSTKWALLYTIAPFAAAFFSYIYFSERITKRKLLGLCIALIGLVPLLLTESAQEQSLRAFLYISWPEIAIVCSALSFAYGWIVTRSLLREAYYPSTLVNGIGMLLTGFGAFGTSLFVDTWYPTPISEHWMFFQIVVAISLFNILYYLLNTYLLKKYTVTFLTLMSAIDPLYVAFYSWVLLGEVVTWHFFASLIIIFVGIYLFYQEEIKQGYIIS